MQTIQFHQPNSTSFLGSEFSITTEWYFFIRNLYINAIDFFVVAFFCFLFICLFWYRHYTFIIHRSVGIGTINVKNKCQLLVGRSELLPTEEKNISIYYCTFSISRFCKGSTIDIHFIPYNFVADCNKYSIRLPFLMLCNRHWNWIDFRKLFLLMQKSSCNSHLCCHFLCVAILFVICRE